MTKKNSYARNLHRLLTTMRFIAEVRASLAHPSQPYRFGAIVDNSTYELRSNVETMTCVITLRQSLSTQSCGIDFGSNML